MEAEGEEGMLHSLLTALPELSDGFEGSEKPTNTQDIETKILPDEITQGKDDAGRTDLLPEEVDVVASVDHGLSDEASKEHSEAEDVILEERDS